MKLFNGMLVLTVQSSDKAGKMKVTASTKDGKIAGEAIVITVKG
jgi:hypothetical protein